MRTLVLSLLLLLSITTLFGQAANKPQERIEQAYTEGIPFQPVSIYSRVTSLESGMLETVAEGHLLYPDNNAVATLLQQHPTAISLTLPLSNGQVIAVDLLASDILSADFVLSTSDGSESDYQSGLYYHGVIQGDAGSWAAISIFRNEVIGVLYSPSRGEMILGNLSGDQQQRHVLYPIGAFQIPLDFSCSALPTDQAQQQTPDAPEAFNPANCVRIYFECEYDMFLENGSVTATVNKMTGIYNVVKVLYDNENINTVISEIFVWNTPDGYPTSSTSNVLSAFRNARQLYNGDLAHLISRGAPSGGGIAYVDALCSTYGHAYSYIYSTYSQFPTYSWTVNVIAHEMGHNLGARHTHDCVWDVNGDGIAAEAIDGCGPAAGYSGGNCSTGPLPSNGGTVMSYCHLLGSVGINLNNGFGPIPGNLIRDRVYNSNCLTPCSNCPVMVSITKEDVACHGETTGTATATASGGTGNYLYNWSNGQNGATATGLTAGNYTVTITDDNGNGCTTTESITINQPTAITTSIQTTPESVPGAGNGAIDLTVSGGTPSYAYAWSNGATTQDLTNITGGTYTVTITDGNSCTVVTSATVLSTGCALQATSFPYQESFEDGLGLWSQGTNDNFDWTRNSGSTSTRNTGPNGAADGTFYLYTEANGNTGDAHLISPCLDLDGKVNTSITFQYHMYGSNMGILSLQVSTDNGNTWTTIWNRSGNQGNGWLSASVSLDNYRTAYTQVRFTGTLNGGQRSDMAIDAINIQAENPPCNAPVLSLSSTLATCAGAADGSASVTATGGAAGYTYVWSNGGTTQTITGLTAGNYVVTVTDAEGCAATGSVVVGEPAPIVLSFAVTPESTSGAADGAIDLTVSSNTAPYSYLWSTAATTEDISNLSAGAYSVSVTDVNGCLATGNVEVTVIPACVTMPLPYSESFESGLGSWTQDLSDGFDWTRNSGSTGTRNTGPSGAFDGTWYMYTESNGVSSGSEGNLISPCIDLTSAQQPQLTFSYHMYGNQMGSLLLSASTDNGQTWTTIWSRSGQQGTNWLTASVPLAAFSGTVLKLRFTGIMGGVRSDMAIDAISISDNAATMPTANINQQDKGWEWTSLFPNPARNEVTLQFIAAEQQELPVIVMDAGGRRVLTRQIQIPAGNSRATLPLGELPAGIYLVTLGEGTRQQIKRLVIQP